MKPFHLLLQHSSTLLGCLFHKLFEPPSQYHTPWACLSLPPWPPCRVIQVISCPKIPSWKAQVRAKTSFTVERRESLLVPKWEGLLFVDCFANDRGIWPCCWGSYSMHRLNQVRASGQSCNDSGKSGCQIYGPDTIWTDQPISTMS